MAPLTPFEKPAKPSESPPPESAIVVMDETAPSLQEVLGGDSLPLRSKVNYLKASEVNKRSAYATSR